MFKIHFKSNSLFKKFCSLKTEMFQVRNVSTKLLLWEGFLTIFFKQLKNPQFALYVWHHACGFLGISGNYCLERFPGTVI